jgi:hypothetical protein
LIEVRRWALVLALSVAGCATERGPRYPWSAAFRNYAGQLEVFPLGEPSFSVALPAAVTWIDYAPDGESLYGISWTNGTQITQINDHPLKTLRVVGTGGVVPGEVAPLPSSTHLVISGRYGAACGIFEFDPVDGSVRAITEDSGCQPGSIWEHLSASTDGTRLVAHRRSGLAVIELATGGAQALSPELIRGAWSPDGKWLAVIDEAGNRTDLLDSKSLKRQRALPPSNAQWSPDSRYLLGARRGLWAALTALSPSCLGYWSTLVAVDATTGREQTIASSACKVNLGTTVWVDREIGP